MKRFQHPLYRPSCRLSSPSSRAALKRALTSSTSGRRTCCRCSLKVSASATPSCRCDLRPFGEHAFCSHDRVSHGHLFTHRAPNQWPCLGFASVPSRIYRHIVVCCSQCLVPAINAKRIGAGCKKEPSFQLAHRMLKNCVCLQACLRSISESRCMLYHVQHSTGHMI